MADSDACALARKQLAEAEAALHAQTIGGRQIKVKYGEKEIGFAEGRPGDLQRYVQQLRGNVATECGECFRGARRAVLFIPS